MVASRSIWGRMLDAVAKSAATRVVAERAAAGRGASSAAFQPEHYLDAADRHFRNSGKVPKAVVGGQAYVTPSGRKVFPT